MYEFRRDNRVNSTYLGGHWLFVMYGFRRDNREYSTLVSLTELPERVVNLTVSAHAHYATGRVHYVTG